MSAIACAVGLSIGATEAQAVSLGKARDVEYVRSTQKLVGQPAKKGIECPGLSEALGGGGTIDGPARRVTLNENRPLPFFATGWTVSGSARGERRRPLRAYAVCSTAIDATYPSEPFDGVEVPGGGSAQGTAGCPEGLYATAGGVFGATPGIVVTGTYAERLQVGGWLSTVFNPGAESTLVQFGSVCVPPDRARADRESPRVPIRPGESKRAVARCESRELVEAGGWRALAGPDDQSAPASAIATRPWDSGDRGTVPDDGWVVVARNDTDARIKLIASASCRDVRVR